MLVDPERARLYRLMRRVGLGFLPLTVLSAVVVGIGFGVVPGVIVGVIAVSLSLYQAFAFPHVNERLRRRIQPTASSVARGPGAWPNVRRRFLCAGALATVWVVGTSATVGFFVGGLAFALVTGGLLLVAIVAALLVAHTRLRRKYLLGV